jgi:hypothetical protein
MLPCVDAFARQLRSGRRGLGQWPVLGAICQQHAQSTIDSRAASHGRSAPGCSGAPAASGHDRDVVAGPAGDAGALWWVQRCWVSSCASTRQNARSRTGRVSGRALAFPCTHPSSITPSHLPVLCTLNSPQPVRWARCARSTDALAEQLPPAVEGRLPEYRPPSTGPLLRLAHPRRLCSPSPTAVNTPTAHAAHAPTRHPPPAPRTLRPTLATPHHGSLTRRRASAPGPDGQRQDGHRTDGALSQRPQHKASQRNHIAITVPLRIASTARLWHAAAAVDERPADVLVHPQHPPDARSAPRRPLTALPQHAALAVRPAYAVGEPRAARRGPPRRASRADLQRGRGGEPDPAGRGRESRRWQEGRLGLPRLRSPRTAAMVQALVLLVG